MKNCRNITKIRAFIQYMEGDEYTARSFFPCKELMIEGIKSKIINPENVRIQIGMPLEMNLINNEWVVMLICQRIEITKKMREKAQKEIDELRKYFQITK